MPHDGWSNSSSPGRPDVGIPSLASATRARARSLAGTIICVPPLSRRYWIFSVRSRSVSTEVFSSATPLTAGTHVGRFAMFASRRMSSAAPTPAAMIIARRCPPTRSTSGATLRGISRGLVASWVPDAVSTSGLHVHERPVRIQELVAYLHQHLDGNASLLGGSHHLVQLHRLTANERAGERFRLLLHGRDFADRACEQRAERPIARC